MDNFIKKAAEIMKLAASVVTIVWVVIQAVLKLVFHQ